MVFGDLSEIDQIRKLNKEKWDKINLAIELIDELVEAISEYTDVEIGEDIKNALITRGSLSSLLKMGIGNIFRLLRVFLRIIYAAK